MRARLLALLHWQIAHRRRVLAAYALLALAMLPGVARLDSDNSAEAFLLHDAPEVEQYRAVRARFGSDEVMRVVLAGEGLWSADGLAFLQAVETEVAALPGVESATGLYGRHRLAGWPPRDPDAFREGARADLLDRQLGFIDATGARATVLVTLEQGSAAEREPLLAGVRRLVATPPAGIKASLAGLPVIDEALDGSAREIQLRFSPLLVLFAVVLLAVSMRNLASVAVPLTFVLTTQLLTLGPMGYLGVKLNLVLAILPPLTFVIVLATAVHLLVRYRELLSLGRDAIAAAAETYRDKGWAVLWTGVTTLVGFGSLGSSPVGPVRSLGLWSSIALTVMLAAAFSLYPALLVSWVGSGRSDRRALEGLLRRHGRAWAEGAARRRRVWMTAAALVLGLSAVGTGRLRVESNALTYLAAEHPARRAVEALEASGIGSAAVELVLSLPPSAAGDGGFRQRQRLQALAALAAELRRGELVTGVVSAGDVAAAGSGVANELGGFGALAAQGALEQALRPFLAADGGTTRLTLFTHIVGFDRLDRLREVAAAAARRAFPAAAVTVTGQYPLLLETQRRLISTLSTSFSVTLLCVAVILAFLVGHWRYMLLSLVPSAGPVLCVLGLMGWAGVPLDVATVMVAAVILGLAVDDTIHTLNHFRELAPKVGRLEAVASTLEHTAGAYVLSGLILVAGFGVCALSSFAPTARFGGLSAVGIALSVVGAIFVVPALLGKAER